MPTFDVRQRWGCFRRDREIPVGTEDRIDNNHRRSDHPLNKRNHSRCNNNKVFVRN